MATVEKKKEPSRSPRHIARIFALLGLYQWLVNPEQDIVAIRAHLAGLIQDECEPLEQCSLSPKEYARCDHAFMNALLRGVLERMGDIEPLVRKHIDRDLAHVALVERAILFLGTYELLASMETPWRVIMNESIELAKEFGGGYRFTNAVLDKIATEVRTEEMGK